MLRSLWCGLTIAFFTVVTVNAQVAEIPYLTGRVTDNAEILSSQSRQRLAEMVKAFELSSDGAQIAILTMPSLENGSIEEFAARVFKAWKLGEKGKDNGLLLIVSPGDRRIRIEVGSGLRDNVSEASASRIIRDLIAPRFNEGDYDKGLEEGVGAIIGQLTADKPERESVPERARVKKDSFSEGADLGIAERILIGCFIFGIIGLFTVIGVVTPGVGWFLYLFLIPFWAMFPIIVIGVRGALTLLVIYLIGFPSAKLYLSRSDWYEKAKAQLASKGVAQIGGFTINSGGAGTSWTSSWGSRRQG
jgi:uncharacterized protein